MLTIKYALSSHVMSLNNFCNWSSFGTTPNLFSTAPQTNQQLENLIGSCWQQMGCEFLTSPLSPYLIKVSILASHFSQYLVFFGDHSLL